MAEKTSGSFINQVHSQLLCLHVKGSVCKIVNSKLPQCIHRSVNVCANVRQRAWVQKKHLYACVRDWGREP